MNLSVLMERHAAYQRHAWMTDDQWFLACFVAWIVGGFHHVTGTFRPCGYGVRITLLNAGFSTIDRDLLTAIVFAAHDAAVRVDLCNGAPGRIGLMLHRRVREGALHEAHPTLEHAVAKWRGRNPAQEATCPAA